MEFEPRNYADMHRKANVPAPEPPFKPINRVTMHYKTAGIPVPERMPPHKFVIDPVPMQSVTEPNPMLPLTGQPMPFVASPGFGSVGPLESPANIGVATIEWPANVGVAKAQPLVGDGSAEGRGPDKFATDVGPNPFLEPEKVAEPSSADKAPVHGTWIEDAGKK